MNVFHHPMLVYLYALEVGDTPLAEALGRAMRRDRARSRGSVASMAQPRSLAQRTLTAVESVLGLSRNGH
ncbi:MAG: hypothetical protein ACR2NH_04615 [Solirubrobacteraceae bacterium]